MTQVQGNLFDAAAACLGEPDPACKQAATQAAAEQWRTGGLRADAAGAAPACDLPGRPARPDLVPPRALKARKLMSREGRAAMIHAVAHIEFNAINLAWDAVQRFRAMPTDFYADWIRVAAEEAEHFGLMRNRLGDLGYDYGDFPAHDGLWEMARATAHDPLVRMALVPRVLEARGLDVTPGMIARFEAAGDPETAACLGVILRDEVGHVAVGSRWFRRLCAERGLDPGPLFFDLLGEYMRAGIRCPLNLPARREAGFDEVELDRLQALCRAGEGG
ncbi:MULTISPECIES: ferritin-like domain-containing protein [unclassified Thiocapsa]|uniref:ferritin-like domain-containing protein n=1 Tax=unclassified Thiocapsa TaxID=2641286 RepID=UPI0035B3428A